MRNVVLDTNCLVQMISVHSPYRPVWQAFREGEFYLCVSDEILYEYLEVLGRLTNTFVAENIVNAIKRSPFTKHFDPRFRFMLIEQDEDDNKFTDCAVIANADYIVSEDSHFNVLKRISFPKLNLVTLDEFMFELQHL